MARWIQLETGKQFYLKALNSVDLTYNALKGKVTTICKFLNECSKVNGHKAGLEKDEQVKQYLRPFE